MKWSRGYQISFCFTHTHTHLLIKIKVLDNAIKYFTFAYLLIVPWASLNFYSFRGF
jgi:hypothetical protein